MKTWKKRIIIGICVALVLSACVFAGVKLYDRYGTPVPSGDATFSSLPIDKKRETQEPKPQTKYDVGPPDATEILELVNLERARVGVESLVVEDVLNRSAAWKANDIVINSNYAHGSKDGTQRNNGLDYLYGIDGGACSYAGENLKAHDVTKANSQVIVDGWMDSESHRKALLDPRYKTTGIAQSNDGYRVFVVQHFCQP